MLEVIHELETNFDTHPLSVSNITKRFIERFENDYDRKITPKWIGGLIRQRLGLKTERWYSNYIISPQDRPKLVQLYQRYGLAALESNTEPNPLITEAGTPENVIEVP